MGRKSLIILLGVLGLWYGNLTIGVPKGEIADRLSGHGQHYSLQTNCQSLRPPLSNYTRVEDTMKELQYVSLMKDLRMIEFLIKTYGRYLDETTFGDFLDLCNDATQLFRRLGSEDSAEELYSLAMDVGRKNLKGAERKIKYLIIQAKKLNGSNSFLEELDKLYRSMLRIEQNL